MATLLGLLTELLADGPPARGTRVGVVDSKGREYVIEFGEVQKASTADLTPFLIGR